VRSGLYIHWPYCEAICPYCDFNVYRARSAAPLAWGEALPAAMMRCAARWPDLTLASIYFGGGTPSLMDPQLVADLIALARRIWPVEDPLEITLEANPTSAEADRFGAFAEAGVNRLSLGVQSLRDDQLQFLGRWHSAAEAHAAYERARAAFASVSIDLIYALPEQRAADWRGELHEALAWQPDHLAAYQLTVEPGTAFDAQTRRGRFSPMDEDRAADLYKITQEETAQAGLPAYEVSNHARGQARSVHNQGYWQGRPYLGLGPGAHGRLPTGDGGWTATYALKTPADWLASVAAGGAGISETPLPAHSRAVERVLMGLRQTEGLVLDHQIEAVLDPDMVARLAADGLIAIVEDRLIVPAHARLLTDGLANRLIA